MARKYSSEYKALQPYVVEDARKVANAVLAGAASGGGGGGMVAHTIYGPYHTGELLQSQASWAATKAELSNHAALPDVHHAKSHGITDSANHTVTGSQYQIVGLTSANTLGLLTPSSSPTANQVVKTNGSSAVQLVDLTVTGNIYSNGYLDFGTNTMYEDASYLQVTGAKPVRFGQNIGNANWTVYNAGGAQFGGSVDIISGGDLTVIGSGSYAGSKVLFADSSGGNVGIMMNPDPQFALDINGPARATYWIGPHAIQLKGVLLLAHYDGRAPYETNYSGEPNGHMGQVATVSGGVIYRPGMFYKAVQIAEATTNLIKNPSWEVDTSSWTSSGFTLYLRQTDMPYIGSAGGYVKVTAHNSTTNESLTTTNITDMAVAASTAYTVSVHARGTKTGTGTIYVFWYTAASAFISSSSFAMPSGSLSSWTRIAGTVTSPVNAAYARVAIATDGCTNATVFELWLDAVQFEQKAYLTPYCDGSLGDGHTWTGTAHASSSTRTAAQLSYATAGNVAAVGTIAFWVKLDALRNWQMLWRLRAGEATHGVDCYVDASGNIVFRLDGSTVFSQANAAITAGAWTHIACTWNGSTSALYVNGALKDSDSGGAFYGMESTLWIGSNGGASYFINGLIDDFCILDRAADAKEILAVYESNAPVFAETSTFSFRPTPKGLIWADDEGLWMRDTAGKPVLGVYGGEAATKNWGGFNLVPGDLLLGNNAVGSSGIWWSRVNGTFGFYGAGSGTPQVEIATDGRLTAGAGKVKLDSTGFHAFNASNVATIDINDQGIYLGDGGARTTIGNWSSGNRIRAYNVGELYEATPETYLDDSSISRTLYPLVIRGIRQGNDAGLVEISAVNTSNVGAFLRVGEGFRLKDYYGTPYYTNRMVHAKADDIILEATNLQLRSLTTSTAAVGTYSGKIRIQIAGTNYYIPYYAS